MLTRPAPALTAMLEPRSVALVGASARPDSLAYRALLELERSPRVPTIHLVNPNRAGETIRDRRVLASLQDVEGPVDLVLLAVADSRLEAALHVAARRGDRSAVIFGGAVDPTAGGNVLRDRIARLGHDAGMAICGAGCMGFISESVRAIGYLEPAPLPRGNVALVTHSGSAFSALLRADRPFGWTLAVSSGQELVTTAADYVDYALDLAETRVVALVLETLHDPEPFQATLARAAETGVPVVTLAVGSSAAGRAMVAAHSGALAGSEAVWEALSDRFGMLRVADFAELCDTVELLLAQRRPPLRREGAAHDRRPLPEVSGEERGSDAPTGGRGIAAVLDSGAERALLVDVADAEGLPFAEIATSTRSRLAAVLDPGLEVDNPLDVWGSGRATQTLFSDALVALAEDERVDAVALAVDLVPEYDRDDSYRVAVLDAWDRTAQGGTPMCVLNHVPSALDHRAARTLRERGVPVLEGTRSGLRALGNLLALRDHLSRPARPVPAVDEARRARWRERLGNPSGGRRRMAAALLADYGIPMLESELVRSASDACIASERLGYPVVLKTAVPGIAHKSDVGGVLLNLATSAHVEDAYRDLSRRLGPDVTVSPMAGDGVDLSVGTFRDPLLGPLVVVGAGGTLVELLADRSVALPPIGTDDARRMVDRLRLRRLLDGYRGAAAADFDEVLRVVTAVSQVATELGDLLLAFEVNPLRSSTSGALALDVLLEW